MKNKYRTCVALFAALLYCLGPGLRAQDKTKFLELQGKVVDESGKPIANAAVYANQGDKMTLTNAAGVFKIRVEANTPLLVEYPGYDSKEVNTAAEADSVILTPSDILFGPDAEMPLAFREEKKGLLVGNVSTIDVAEILRNDKLPNVQSLLSAYGAGLREGINLLGLGDALVVVDGLPRHHNNLMPEEIEDISILKDVNAAVLYGSRAKNGVILIKTKRGKALKKEAKFNLEFGLNTPIQLPKYLGSKDYLTLYREAQLNDNPGRTPDKTLEDIANYSGANPYRYPDVNYYSSDFLKPSYASSRFVGEFTGGNKVASYYTNVAWDHYGVLYKSDTYSYGTDVLRVRSNVDYKINSYLSSYLNAAFVMDINTTPRSDFFEMASTFRPDDYAPFLPESVFEDPSLIAALKKTQGNAILGALDLTSHNTYGKNIYGELNWAGYSRTYWCRLPLDAGVVFDMSQLLPGLKLKADLSFDTYVSYSEQIRNTYALYKPVWNAAGDRIESLKTINSDTRTGKLSLSSGSLYRSLMADAGLDYDAVFAGGHHVSASALAYYSMATVAESLHSIRSTHLGMRLGYDYKRRYIFDFSASLIASNKLMPGKRSALSPSAGLAWLISEEPFWSKDSFFDVLKLKLTGGVLHTDASPAFTHNLFREIYAPGASFNTGDASGYEFQSTYVLQTANKNLQMEKMKNVNLGLELALLDKTLFIDASVFKTRHSDQVVRRMSFYPTLLSTFYPYENYNETDYTGFDFSLSYRKSFGDVSLNALWNLLYAQSAHITYDELYPNSYQYHAGKASDAIWGLAFTGFFKSDAEALAANQRFGTIRRGDMSYLDKDDNKQVDENDIHVIGNYSPRLKSALNLTLGYKQWALFLGMSTRLGYNWMMNSDYFWIDGNKKYSEIALNRWTDETAETATYPRLSAQSSSNNFRESSFWLRNGNDFSLDRLQLNYMFSKKSLQRIFLREIGLYLRADNLLFLAEDAKLRQTATSVQTRNVSIGLKVSF